MFGPLLKLVNDQTGRDYIEADFLQDPFHGPQVFQIPLASKRQVLGGDNIFRDGADIVATKRENAGLQIQTGFQECDFEKLMALKAKMERLCEQARLRSERGWGPKVELQWRPEGKYYARYADILDGDLDMPMNWLKMETPRHTVRPEDCILSLIRKPYWREDEETLDNFVENPSFLLDVGEYAYGGTCGFDAWRAIGGATCGVDTINWVQGGQCAYIICPSFAFADSGLESENIVLVADTWYYVEAWIWYQSGNRITLRIERQTGPAWLIPVVQWTPGFNIMPVMDEQAGIVDRGWREPGFIRKGFVFRAPASGDYRINIGVTVADDVGGETHFDVDRVYLTEAANLNWTAEADRVLDPTDDWKETYLMPRAWCSGKQITGHTDLGDCVHAQEQPNLPGYENHIAYLDVEDVPGNLQAPMDLEAQLISIGKITEDPPGYPNRWYQWYLGRRTQDDLKNFIWEYDAAQLDDLGSTPFTLVADTYAPSCFRAQAAITVVDFLGWDLANVEDLYGSYQAYLLAYATVDPSQIRVSICQTFNWDWSDYVPIEGTGPFYHIHPMGLMRFPGVVEPTLPWDALVGFPATVPQIRLDCRRDAGAAVLRIAGVILIPVDEGSLIVDDLAYAIDIGGMMAQEIQSRYSVYWITATRTARWQLNFVGLPVSLIPREWNRLISLSGIKETVGDTDLFAPALVQELRLRYEPRFL